MQQDNDGLRNRVGQKQFKGFKQQESTNSKPFSVIDILKRYVTIQWIFLLIPLVYTITIPLSFNQLIEPQDPTRFLCRFLQLIQFPITIMISAPLDFLTPEAGTFMIGTIMLAVLDHLLVPNKLSGVSKWALYVYNLVVHLCIFLVWMYKDSHKYTFGYMLPKAIYTGLAFLTLTAILMVLVKNRMVNLVFHL